MKLLPSVPLFTGVPPLPDARILQNKLLLRPDEVAAILRISRRKVYDMVELSELEAVRIGHSLRIRTQSVLALLHEDDGLDPEPR
jgi:excisionase family DNA binding protein